MFMRNRPRHIFGTHQVPHKALGGLLKDLSTRLFGSMPRKTAKWLDRYGEKIPSDIYVVRAPIKKYISTLLNALSLNEFSRLSQKYGYDTFYHLSLVFTIDGATYRLEKNETISISPYHAQDDEEEIFVGNTLLTMNEILNKTQSIMTPSLFYNYDAFSNNCQNFIISVITAMNLLTDTVKKFILQPIENLAKELPGAFKYLANTATDLAAAASNIKDGVKDSLGFKHGGLTQ